MLSFTYVHECSFVGGVVGCPAAGERVVISPDIHVSGAYYQLVPPRCRWTHCELRLLNESVVMDERVLD